MLENIEIMKNNLQYCLTHNKNLTKTQYYKLDQVNELLNGFSSVQGLLENIYLEYVNNYLTVKGMAEQVGIEEKLLFDILEVGQKINKENEG